MYMYGTNMSRIPSTNVTVQYIKSTIRYIVCMCVINYFNMALEWEIELKKTDWLKRSKNEWMNDYIN